MDDSSTKEIIISEIEARFGIPASTLKENFDFLITRMKAFFKKLSPEEAKNRIKAVEAKKAELKAAKEGRKDTEGKQGTPDQAGS